MRKLTFPLLRVLEVIIIYISKNDCCWSVIVLGVTSVSEEVQRANWLFVIASYPIFSLQKEGDLMDFVEQVCSSCLFLSFYVLHIGCNKNSVSLIVGCEAQNDISSSSGSRCWAKWVCPIGLAGFPRLVAGWDI
jgi:hypothetical protein